jgi:hypothetical protein
MALTTLAGSTPTQVQTSGINEFRTGPFVASVQTLDLRDLQELTRQSALAGVQISGAITATGLVVSIPAGLQYYARQLWVASGTTTILVPDGSTSYVWGCSDGLLRVTTSGGSPVLPTSFDARMCCLLCKAVAVAGAVTITTTLQQTARYADATNRLVREGPLTIDYANAVVDVSTGALRIPSVTADPTVPGTGTYLWFRSDTLQMCVSVSGTIKRSVAFT